MKRLVCFSYVDVIGEIWLPGIGPCAQRISLRPYDIENIRDGGGKITRESIEQWLRTHAGDFRSITDFSASIEDGEDTLDFAWANEESECVHSDCMYPDRD